jgi:hypothetical protein
LDEERSPPIPAALLAQARLAARSGVSLDAVLRRCLAGHTLFCGFLIDAVEAAGRLRAEATFLRLWRVQAATFERLIEALIEEYARADALIS